MKVLVCGGRDYKNKNYTFKVLDYLDEVFSIEDVIEGGQRTHKIIGSKKKIIGGADYWGHLWQVNRGRNPITVPADWDRYGKSAGAIRNGEMLKLKPDLVIAFKGGNGTADMVSKSRAKGVKVLKVPEDFKELVQLVETILNF